MSAAPDRREGVGRLAQLGSVEERALTAMEVDEHHLLIERQALVCCTEGEAVGTGVLEAAFRPGPAGDPVVPVDDLGRGTREEAGCYGYPASGIRMRRPMGRQ